MSERRIPPMVHRSAIPTLYAVARPGRGVRRSAAAPGVMRSVRIRSTPTTWIASATAAAKTEPEGHDAADHHIASARAHPEGADEHGGYGSAHEESEHGGEPQQNEPRRAGEAELGEGVYGERHVSRDDEAADDAGDDRD